MKNYILVNNKKEILERNKDIRKDDWTLIGENFFQACEYDEQTNTLNVNYIAYGITTTRQWLNSPAVPYIMVLTNKENLKIQQELQRRLCVSEMKRLIKANQEIRFHNTEYGIEGAGKSLKEAIETFIDDTVEYMYEGDCESRGDDAEIYFYNMENCEIYLPKKYINQIWDEIECIVIDKINRRIEDDEDSVINFFYDEATKAEKLREMNEGR